MAMVIAVAQQKGGAGKTTIAANLAACFAAERRVGLIDIDPQHSLARWHRLRAARTGVPAIAFAEVAGWRLPAEVQRLSATCDVVLLDSAPQVEADAGRAIRAAGLVLVPIQPSPPDLWAATATLALAARERRPAVLVLNRAPAASRLRAEVEAEIAREGFALLPVALGNRLGYAQAFATGLGVTESAPRSVAAAELRALARAIEEIAR